MSTTKELCQLFLADNDLPKYFFGSRFDAPLRLMEAYPNVHIQGIIDEFTSDSEYHGIPILHSIDLLPKEHLSNAIICNTILGRYRRVKDRLDAIGLQNFWYCSLVNLVPDERLETDFWQGFKQHYHEHEAEYRTMMASFADDTSRVILTHLIEYRCTGNEESMAMFTDNDVNQYWESFLKLRSDGVFVDAGCFDAATSLEYIKRIGEGFHRIYIFEPDKNQMNICKQNMSAFSNVRYCPVGAWNKHEFLHFVEDDKCSALSEKGTITVEVDAIDNYIEEAPATQIYIKMDIEGAEKEAIEGTRRTIVTYHPVLAISIYHRGEDFLEIYKKVMSIRKDYNVYVRHYLSGTMETVMYFIPKE